MPQTAVIAGATGLVGRHCLSRLSSEAHYEKTIALVRRPGNLAGDRVIERIVRFNSLDREAIPAGSDVFCALGTTLRKAGSKEEFRRVDLDSVVDLARISHQRGAGQFLVISSVGANPSSSSFYLRTKGEMEKAVSAMAFETVHIFRPSFLLGQRTEARPGERLGSTAARLLSFALLGPLRSYSPIDADELAVAMVRAAKEARPGVHVYHYNEIPGLAHSA